MEFSIDEIKKMRINGNKEPKDEMRDRSLEEEEKGYKRYERLREVNEI